LKVIAVLYSEKYAKFPKLEVFLSSGETVGRKRLPKWFLNKEQLFSLGHQLNIGVYFVHFKVRGPG
jgi:hypothetical protein